MCIRSGRPTPAPARCQRATDIEPAGDHGLPPGHPLGVHALPRPADDLHRRHPGGSAAAGLGARLGAELADGLARDAGHAVSWLGVSLLTGRMARSGPSDRNRVGFMKLTSVAVPPSRSRSAATAPSAAAILNPCPEKPTATATPSMPGTRPSKPVSSTV